MIGKKIQEQVTEFGHKLDCKSTKEMIYTECNPRNFEHFIEAFGIDDCATFGQDTDSMVDYLSLRKQQNKDFAMKQYDYIYFWTVDGISLARKNELHAAIKKYDNAIEMDKECVEAFVARGAAYCFLTRLANLKYFGKAIEDLKRAKSIDPTHKNAAKYLNQLLENEQRIEEEKHKVGKSLIAGEFVLVSAAARNEPSLIVLIIAGKLQSEES